MRSCWTLLPLVAALTLGACGSDPAFAPPDVGVDAGSGAADEAETDSPDEVTDTGGLSLRVRAPMTRNPSLMYRAKVLARSPLLRV